MEHGLRQQCLRREVPDPGTLPLCEPNCFFSALPLIWDDPQRQRSAPLVHPRSFGRALTVSALPSRSQHLSAIRATCGCPVSAQIFVCIALKANLADGQRVLQIQTKAGKGVVTLPAPLHSMNGLRRCERSAAPCRTRDRGRGAPAR